MKKACDRAWVIGASAGIGEALAKRLAANGHKVAISARNGAELDRVLAKLEGEGHIAVPLDVTDKDKLADAMERIIAELGSLERVIFMAGIYTPMRLGELDLDETRKTVETNLMGAFNAIHAALPHMLKNGRGQVALCASVAGYRGLPRGQPYGATKAALINLAESLRAEHGNVIDAKVINPGFVVSRLTDKNKFHMPLRITAERAAEHIAKGLYGSSFEIHFPKRFTLMVKLLGALPDFAYFRLVGSKNARGKNNTR